MQTIQTICGMCSNDSCGIDVTVDGNRVTGIRGSAGHPLNQGRLCVQAQGALDLLSDPRRLSHPLKRNGDSWQRISWDEALDTIAEQLSRVKSNFGAQSFVLWEGSAMQQFSRDGWERRFLNLFGSPNWVYHDHMCHMPLVIAEEITYGQVQVDGFEAEHTRCVVLWGSNPATSHNPGQWHAILSAQKLGAKLVVVDPRRNQPAGRADLHLPTRPGTDAALALGLINAIIGADLYDHDFVARWTTGFDRLAERVSSFTPERVESLTGVPAADVTRFARLYAESKPAHLDAGNALEHHSNSAQILRALMILRAITGNLDVPGGNVLGRKLPLADMKLSGRLPAGLRPLGADRYPLFVELAGFVPGDVLMETMLSDQPYPIKAALIAGTNPMLTWPNTTRVRAALERLDFLAVMDLYLTPTARMARIVLPAASAYERTELIANAAPFGIDKPMWWVALRRPVVDPGERRSDWWVLRELACRLGYSNDYPWIHEEQAVADLLRPTGITVADLIASPTGLFYGDPPLPRRYETDGFRTATGKVELFSHVLQSYGLDPLPHFEEPSESGASTPEVAQRYPLILNIGRTVASYTHSRYRGLPRLSKAEPEPVAEIHPDTAAVYGIADGEMVMVETRRGSITLKARLTSDLVPGVVGLVHGWEQANANLLTDDGATDPALATPSLRSGLCRIRRAGASA